MKAKYEIAIWLAVFAIIVAGAAVFAVYAVGEATRDLETSCQERCEGRGQEVASFTIYGCECREIAPDRK